MSRVLFLVIGTSGEYEDTLEWPVALYETEEQARIAAQGASERAQERKAIYDAWYRDVCEPWHRANPSPLASRFPPSDMRMALSQWSNREDRPKAPTLPENPFDPEHGGGHTYRVERVPLLTGMPG